MNKLLKTTTAMATILGAASCTLLLQSHVTLCTQLMSNNTIRLHLRSMLPMSKTQGTPSTQQNTNVKKTKGNHIPNPVAASALIPPAK